MHITLAGRRIHIPHRAAACHRCGLVVRRGAVGTCVMRAIAPIIGANNARVSPATYLTFVRWSHHADKGHIHGPQS